MSDCIELLKIAVAAGDVEGWPIPFPITEPETVNERRKALGLNSLEERLEQIHERERQRRVQQSATKAAQWTSR